MQTNKGNAISVFSPAKINLFLAIHGKRDDGFHDLTSLVAPLRFGDDLTLSIGSSEDSLTLKGDVLVPLKDNLILKAIAFFREIYPDLPPVDCQLIKRIPVGAGLGGGSSNATAVLKGLNQLMGEPLMQDQLAELAAQLGSDCSLFLYDQPVLMRGRGERVERLAYERIVPLRALRVLVFKASFSIETVWAYENLGIQGKDCYSSFNETFKLIESWLTGEVVQQEQLYNSFTQPVGEKYFAIPCLLSVLRDRFGLCCSMSGSGSACFAILENDMYIDDVIGEIRECWGKHTFVVETSLL